MTVSVPLISKIGALPANAFTEQALYQNPAAFRWPGSSSSPRLLASCATSFPRIVSTAFTTSCTADQFTASANSTGTGTEFKFDRLGVRVPAILISPWIPKNTVVDRVFDHASIPATITNFFLSGDAKQSPREIHADVFIESATGPVDPQKNLLSLGTKGDLARAKADVDDSLKVGPVLRLGAQNVCIALPERYIK